MVWQGRLAGHACLSSVESRWPSPATNNLELVEKVVTHRLGSVISSRASDLCHGSVQARYTHITREMREELLANLTAEWEASLHARLAMCPTTPVAVLNDLLREQLGARG